VRAWTASMDRGWREDVATCDGEAGVKEQREVRQTWLKPGYAETERMVVSPKLG
jgi:hypothetical protein